MPQCKETGELLNRRWNGCCGLTVAEHLTTWLKPGKPFVNHTYQYALWKILPLAGNHVEAAVSLLMWAVGAPWLGSALLQ